jgi:hypothetical protein
MMTLAVVGAMSLIFIGVPALFVLLDCACAKIARALRDSIRP